MITNNKMKEKKKCKQCQQTIQNRKKWQTLCKQCKKTNIKGYSNKWNKNHPEYARQASRQYYYNNIEKAREYGKQYNLKNREKINKKEKEKLKECIGTCYLIKNNYII